jgi:hypothetical protein
MSNDLSRGLFPADQVKLLVVDEAHRAQGDYAYCQVFIILLLRTKCFKFRLLKFVGRVVFLWTLTSKPILIVHISNKRITGRIVACTIEFASPRDNHLIYTITDQSASSLLEMYIFCPFLSSLLQIKIYILVILFLLRSRSSKSWANPTPFTESWLSRQLRDQTSRQSDSFFKTLW